MNRLTVYAPIRRIFVHPWDALLLFIVWVGVNGGLYWHYGVKVVNDAPRYLDYAQRIANGAGWYEPYDVWYLGYTLFILVVKVIFDSEGAIVLMQVLVQGIAAIILYRTSYRLFRSRAVALITALLFLSWIELSTWNFFVMTESLYISLICLVLYSLTSFDGSRKKWLLTTGVVLFTFITRPTGVAVLVAYGVFLLSHYWSWIRSRQVVSLVIVLLLLSATYLLINHMLEGFVLSENYVTGEIIYRASSLRNYPNQEWLVVNAASGLYIPSESFSPISRLLLFILHNPLYFFKLFFAKLLYFVGHVKPYYSWIHNVIIILVLYPLYFFSWREFKDKTLSAPFRVFCICLLTVSTLSVSLTTLDWDGRFFVPLLPVIFLLGVGGSRQTLDTLYTSFSDRLPTTRKSTTTRDYERTL